MDSAYRVEQVRAAETATMAQLPAGELMRRAATALARRCVELLDARGTRVAGAQIVLLIGAGDNGGDALFAGAQLAGRGADVKALCCAPRHHGAGAAALRAARGRIVELDAAAGPVAGAIDATGLIAGADLVIDGILGIGGTGALRRPAAELAVAAAAGSALVVAVDLPSGVDADTGAVADPGAVVAADVTVTFGCLKVGLIVSPGALQAGTVELIDIGIAPQLPVAAPVSRMDAADAECWLAEPGPLDNKYTRGVVGVVAGSRQYPGAGVLCTGSARLGGVGMVRYAGTATSLVMSRWPDVVPHPDGPVGAGRVQAWVFGPGAGTDSQSADKLAAILDSPVPVLVDADGLTLLADNPDLRDRVKARHNEGLVTALTPHEGEFARLGFEPGVDRLRAVIAAARELGACILLKGAITLVAEPGGCAWSNTTASPALATAGSGDVLSGLAGSMLAAGAGRGLDMSAAAEIMAAAAFVHGRAGQLAAAAGGPVTALEILNSVGRAIASIRSAASISADGVELAAGA